MLAVVNRNRKGGRALPPVHGQKAAVVPDHFVGCRDQHLAVCLPRGRIVRVQLAFAGAEVICIK
ncbi:MAG: hypothetical protein CL678_09095 [Bdellovibrionaceae bacterium]|nr:hypothetical protein [Pseudobdellovibrionaceae bacterium]